MKTNTAFNINSNSITRCFDQFFKSIQESKFRMLSKKGKLYLNIPLLLALVIALIFPVSIIFALVALLVFKSNISIVQEEKAKDKGPKMIELK